VGGLRPRVHIPDVHASQASGIDFPFGELNNLEAARKFLRFEQRSRGTKWRNLLGKLIRRVFPKFRLKSQLASLWRRSAAIPAMGKTFHVDLRDEIIGSSLLLEGVWEPEETSFVQKSLKPGMVFVDLGANIGYYTVIASGLVGSAGQVIAFEPEPRNFALLKKNIEANGCSNVVAENKAVGASPQRTALHLSRSNFGDHRTHEAIGEPSARTEEKRLTISVEAVSLDHYFKERPTRVDFLKMDIQGTEYDALIGMRQTLQQNPDITVLTEFWPKGLEQAGAIPQSFLSEARTTGFTIYRLAHSGPEPVSDASILGDLLNDDYATLILSRKNLSKPESSK